MSSDSLHQKVTSEVGSGVSELYQRFQCDYCQEDIPGLRVRCADCPDFDLCLECFSCGAQIGKHKNTHKYIFMNNGGFAIFPEGGTGPTVEENNAVTPGGGGSGGGRRRKSVVEAAQVNDKDDEKDKWNAREEMRCVLAASQLFQHKQ